ncbi:MAG: beta-lactamase family protein [Alphaproteobacteria bacterium]|nr:beta-lactamase family protein [Alphaproteobacteria bacterium]
MVARGSAACLALKIASGAHWALSMCLWALVFNVIDARPAAAQSWYEAWSAEAIGAPVSEGRASAAAVAIVEAGRTVLVRGYGHIDGPDSRAVNTNTDRFQIASVSKVFAGALVANSISRDEITSLDQPVNEVLRRIRLPARDGVEITFRHLVTHSAGFEERGFAYFRPELFSDGFASADRLRAALPAQVRAAGEAVVYANIDPVLVAAALEDRTNQTYGALLSTRIFQPLQMNNTRLNTTGARDGLVAPWANGRPLRQGLNGPLFAPTGSIETTPADMALFLHATLGARPDVFSADDLALMTSAHARNHYQLDALGAFWFVSSWGGETIVEHAGGLPGVGAWIILAPGRDVGVFIAWAGGAPSLDYGRLRDSFLAAALGPAAAAAPLAPSLDDARWAGRYWSQRRPMTTAESIVGLDAVSTVEARPDGLYINAQGPFLPQGDNAYAFRPEDGGSPREVAFRDGLLLERVAVSERVRGLSDPAHQRLALLGSVALLFTGFGAWFWRGGRVWGVLAACAGLAAPAVLMLPGADGAMLADDIQAGASLRLDSAAALVMLVGLCALMLLVALLRGPRRAFTATHQALVFAACVVFVAVFAQWKLFAFV